MGARDARRLWPTGEIPEAIGAGTAAGLEDLLKRGIPPGPF